MSRCLSCENRHPFCRPSCADGDAVDDSDHDTENAIVYALEAMRDSKVWRGPMRIDGSVKEFAEDVRAFVKAADDMKEGRNVVSLGTYQAATDEVDALREQVATLTGRNDHLRAQNESYGLDMQMLHEQANSASVMLRLAKEENETLHAGIESDIEKHKREVAALRATIATLTAERDEARKNWRALDDDYNHEAAAHLKTQEQAEADNARHLETIRALRDFISNTQHAVAAGLDVHYEDFDAPLSLIMYASKGYEQADDVKAPTTYTEAEVLGMLAHAAEVGANVDDATIEQIAADVLSEFKETKADGVKGGG